MGFQIDVYKRQVFGADTVNGRRRVVGTEDGLPGTVDRRRNVADIARLRLNAYLIYDGIKHKNPW